jgi:hypothetical protein
MSVYYKCELGATKTKLKEILKERDKYRDLASTVSRELEAIKKTDSLQKLKQIRHQLTNKIAWSLWDLNGRRDGYAEEDWLLAEKLADILLRWKPNGEDTYYKYKI